MQIWDTREHDIFRSITADYIRAADGVILVFDVTDTLSLRKIWKWNDLCLESATLLNKILVGNKNDLQELRRVSIEFIGHFVEL